MRIALFTKVFANRGPEDLGTAANHLGIDAVDLLVRKGTAITPDQPAQVEAAIRSLSRAGVRTEMVTTDLLEATQEAERLLDTLAGSGVTLVRIGHYPYDTSRGYASCYDQARGQLSHLAERAQKAGVRLALQLHPDTVHPSAALASALIAGLPVGSYADAGNQLKEGSEAWPLTLDLLGESLACVSVKNAGWYLIDGNWTVCWTQIDEGILDWPAMIVELKRRGYRGTISLHAPFSFEPPSPEEIRTAESRIPLDIKALTALISA